MEDSLERAVYWWHLGRLGPAHSLFRSPRRLSSGRPEQWKTELQVDTIALLGRWSSKGNFSGSLGKTLICMFIVHIFWKKEPFKLIQHFNSEDGPKMIIHWWHWGRDSALLIVQAFWEAGLLELVKLFLGDVLEMGGHFVLTVGR